MSAENPDIQGYEILERLGEGGFGVVYKARALNGGGVVALKVVKDVGPGAKNHERKTLEFYVRTRSASRKGVIKILDIGKTSGGDTFYTMPLGECDLFTLAKRRRESGVWFSLSEIREILASIFDALEYLESENLIHRDIKPTNIIFIGGKAYLSDLGLLDIADDGAARYGTENFCAPAFFAGNPDHWSVSCVIFFLLTFRATEEWIFPQNWVSPFGAETMSKADLLEYDRLRRVIFDRATSMRAIDVFRSASEFRRAVLPEEKPSGSGRGALAVAWLVFAGALAAIYFGKDFRGDFSQTVSGHFKKPYASDNSGGASASGNPAAKKSGGSDFYNSGASAEKFVPRAGNSADIKASEAGKAQSSNAAGGNGAKGAKSSAGGQRPDAAGGGSSAEKFAGLESVNPKIKSALESGKVLRRLNVFCFDKIATSAPLSRHPISRLENHKRIDSETVEEVEKCFAQRSLAPLGEYSYAEISENGYLDSRRNLEIFDFAEFKLRIGDFCRALSYIEKFYDSIICNSLSMSEPEKYGIKYGYLNKAGFDKLKADLEYFRNADRKALYRDYLSGVFGGESRVRDLQAHYLVKQPVKILTYSQWRENKKVSMERRVVFIKSFTGDNTKVDRKKLNEEISAATTPEAYERYKNLISEVFEIDG